jgi:hypothetical protein
LLRREHGPALRHGPPEGPRPLEDEQREPAASQGTLAKSGLASRIALPGQHVGIQVRTDAGEVLCAAVPSGSFTKKKQSYRFSRKKKPVPTEIGRDLDRGS